MIVKLKENPTADADASTMEKKSTKPPVTGKKQVPKNILIIAQEVKIVQALACNDVVQRNRQMRKLRKWLQIRARSSFPFTDADFLRIWKGLYYNFWMSDKPLVQEELAESMGQLVECFDGVIDLSVRFFGAFILTMCQEWFGIDQWRIDKFMMLVRRMLRYMFRALRAAGWTETSLQLFNEHMENTILNEETLAIGLIMHFLDIFVDELAKVSEGKINAEQVGTLVRPFVTYLYKQSDNKLISHCRTRVLYQLLEQSALGREYQDKYHAWKRLGFPTARIDDLELEEVQDEAATEDDVEMKTDSPNETVLDPRAGNVDVFMPELPVDAKYIIDELNVLINKDDQNTRSRKMLKNVLHVFQTYQRGVYPLGIKSMPRANLKSEKPLIMDKVANLEHMENDLLGTHRKLKQLNKRKRRKLLKSINYDEADESNFDQIIEKSLPKQLLKDRRKRAQNDMMHGWLEELIDDVDAPPKKRKKKITQNENKQAKKTILTNGLGKVKKIKQKKIKLSKKPENINNDSITPIKENIEIKQQEIIVKNAVEEKSNENVVLSTTTTTTITANTTATATPVKQNAPLATLQETPKTTTITTTAKTAEKKKPDNKNKTSLHSEWENPLQDGEIEYFLPSRKVQLKKANSNLVLNPLAKSLHNINKIPKTPTTALGTPKSSASNNNTNNSTPGSAVKRVKIALKHNTIQNPSEYIRQIKSSPNLPYDAEKKPGKGLLKPNLMPSPINPFYKRKIGLRLMNDTI